MSWVARSGSRGGCGRLGGRRGGGHSGSRGRRRGATARFVQQFFQLVLPQGLIVLAVGSRATQAAPSPGRLHSGVD